MSRAQEIADRINTNRTVFHNNDVWEASRLLRKQDEQIKELEAKLFNYTEALWKACGDDENHVNAYLESTK